MFLNVYKDEKLVLLVSNIFAATVCGLLFQTFVYGQPWDQICESIATAAHFVI